MGTYGYAAPEYVMTGEFDSNHIFGFGNYFNSNIENYQLVVIHKLYSFELYFSLKCQATWTKLWYISYIRPLIMIEGLDSLIKLQVHQICKNIG